MPLTAILIGSSQKFKDILYFLFFNLNLWGIYALFIPHQYTHSLFQKYFALEGKTAHFFMELILADEIKLKQKLKPFSCKISAYFTFLSNYYLLFMSERNPINHHAFMNIISSEFYRMKNVRIFAVLIKFRVRYTENIVDQSQACRSLELNQNLYFKNFGKVTLRNNF